MSSKEKGYRYVYYERMRLCSKSSSGTVSGNRLSVNEICEKESITAPFAYKILKKLQKAGIVKGYRGVHGGYAMNKSMTELTLFDVYSAIDPDLFIIECMASGYECPVDGRGDHLPCYMHRELCEIQQGVWKMLKRKNLQEVFAPEN